MSIVREEWEALERPRSWELAGALEGAAARNPKAAGTFAGEAPRLPQVIG